MKKLVVFLILANAAVFAYSWYETYFGRRERPGSHTEFEPDKIRLISSEEAALLSKAVRPRACIEWGMFTVADLPRAQKLLDAAGLRYAERRAEGTSSWWVVVPPLASKQAADQRVEELKRLGVSDYYVVQDEPKFINAISLGVYVSEAVANARRDALAKLGVKDAAVQPRDTHATRVFLRMRDVPPPVAAKLAAAKQEFSGSEVRDCSNDKN